MNPDVYVNRNKTEFQKLNLSLQNNKSKGFPVFSTGADKLKLHHLPIFRPI